MKSAILSLALLAGCSCGGPRKLARADVVNLTVTPAVQMKNEELVGCFYDKPEDRLYCMSLPEFGLFLRAVRENQANQE